MFAAFSLTSACKGYVPTFFARICLLLSLDPIISLYFQPCCAQNAGKYQYENDAIG